MADKTGISWTDATWNPVRGCSRVSEGCRNCYAERVAARFSGPGQPYEGLADRERKGSKWTGVVRIVPEHLADPIRWKRPRRIFVNSMSDLFHESLTNEQIAAVFGVMAAAPQHTFQVLTKRAARMREWFAWVSQPSALARTGADWHPAALRCASAAFDHLEWNPLLAGEPIKIWPLPNVWLGVSVENQAAANERIPELLETPAVVRFLSCEPLLGEVKIGGHLRCPSCGYTKEDVAYHMDHRLCEGPGPRIAWVIVGCESGPGARPCSVEWLRSLRDQCAEAGVALFLKQATSSKGIWMPPDENGTQRMVVTDGAGSKHKAGGVIELPYLDGVQHAAFPETK